MPTPYSLPGLQLNFDHQRYYIERAWRMTPSRYTKNLNDRVVMKRDPWQIDTCKNLFRANSMLDLCCQVLVKREREREGARKMANNDLSRPDESEKDQPTWFRWGRIRRRDDCWLSSIYPPAIGNEITRLGVKLYKGENRFHIHGPSIFARVHFFPLRSIGYTHTYIYIDGTDWRKVISNNYEIYRGKYRRRFKTDEYFFESNSQRPSLAEELSRGNGSENSLFYNPRNPRSKVEIKCWVT